MCPISPPDSVTNETLYFFSTAAQVWAAIIGFGGIIIRDRSIRHDDAMSFAYQQMVTRLRPFSELLSQVTPHYNPDLFLNREAMAKFMLESGDFYEVLDTFKQSQNTVFYPDEETGGIASLSRLQQKLHESIGYYLQYRKDERNRNLLTKELKRVVRVGLIIIVTSLVALSLAWLIAANSYLFLGLVLITIAGTISLFRIFSRAFYVEWETQPTEGQ